MRYSLAQKIVREEKETEEPPDKDALSKDESTGRERSPLDRAVIRIEELTGRIGGNVISVKQTRSPDPTCWMTVAIPGEQVGKFYNQLGKLGRFDSPPEGLSEPLEDSVKIHLTLIVM